MVKSIENFTKFICYIPCSADETFKQFCFISCQFAKAQIRKYVLKKFLFTYLELYFLLSIAILFVLLLF